MPPPELPLPVLSIQRAVIAPAVETPNTQPWKGGVSHTALNAA